MTLQSDGYFDWAWRYPLNMALLNQGGKLISPIPSAMEAICGHSLEGWVSVSTHIRGLLEQGPQRCTAAQRAEVMAALGRVYWAFEDPLRTSTGWHATNMLKVNALIQHAPWHARLAHANAFNGRGPGLEHEGTAANGPIDGHQVATSLRVTRDTEAFYGRPMPWTEHRKWGPTACPSNRLAPLHAALAKGGNEVTKEQYDALVRDIWGSEERREELRRIGVLPIEGRLNNAESNEGPIGKRLSRLEIDLTAHRNAPHTGDGILDEVGDALINAGKDLKQ